MTPPRLTTRLGDRAVAVGAAEGPPPEARHVGHGDDQRRAPARTSWRTRIVRPGFAAGEQLVARRVEVDALLAGPRRAT